MIENYSVSQKMLNFIAFVIKYFSFLVFKLFAKFLFVTFLMSLKIFFAEFVAKKKKKIIKFILMFKTNIYFFVTTFLVLNTPDDFANVFRLSIYINYL